MGENVDNAKNGVKVIHILKRLKNRYIWVMHKVIHIIHKESMWNNDEINKFEKKIEKSIDFFIVKILLKFAFKRKILNFQTLIIRQ